MVRGKFTALRRGRTESVQKVAQGIGVTGIQVNTDSRSQGDTTTIHGVSEQDAPGLAEALRGRLGVTVEIVPELRITWGTSPG